jgi:hypothetical protein
MDTQQLLDHTLIPRANGSDGLFKTASFIEASLRRFTPHVELHTSSTTRTDLVRGLVAPRELESFGGLEPVSRADHCLGDLRHPLATVLPAPILVDGISVWLSV